MIPGVLRTRVGYAGGTKPDPNYQRIGDHAECLQIDYVPTLVSYRDLLDLFWRSHNPTHRSWSPQYSSVILYHDAEQRQVAEESKQYQQTRSGPIHTKIQPLNQFYLAEAYHQKYYLRRVPDIMRELTGRFPTLDELLASPEITRINGYVGGNGTMERLESEIDSLGLSAKAAKRLIQIVESYGK